MKKIFIFCIFLTNYCAFGQSIIISPNDFKKNSSSGFNDIEINRFSNSYGIVIGRTASGSDAAPTNSVNGLELFRIGGGGYANGTFTATRARVSFFTTEQWTTIANGTKMAFYTTPNGSVLATEKMVIDHNGQVGVGISNPSARLHLSGTETEKLRLENTTTLGTGASSEMYFKTGAYFTGAIKTIGTSSQAARIGLFTFSGANSQDLLERLSITDGGNIGIGTSSPNAPLQFTSSIANRKIVLYENANNDHQYVGFGVNGNALRYQVDVPNGSHIFYAATNSSSSNELMRVNNSGLGVGVAIPSEFLDVKGRMRSRHNGLNSSGIWFSNSTNSTSDADGAFWGMKQDNQSGVWLNGWKFWVNNNGDINAIGKVNRTQTGNANMVPIAYGNVNSLGTLNPTASTNNLTVTMPSTGTYEITINNESYNEQDYCVITSLINGSIGFISTLSIDNGKLYILTSDTGGYVSGKNFSFVVYKK